MNHHPLDISYRGACLAIILLMGLIWWIGFIDVCNAFSRLLERVL